MPLAIVAFQNALLATCSLMMWPLREITKKSLGNTSKSERSELGGLGASPYEKGDYIHSRDT